MAKECVPAWRDLLLVDYENVQKRDLSVLPDSVQIRIFVGTQQKAIPIALVEKA